METLPRSNRETHVKHTDMDTQELYWKEREILITKAKMLAQGKLKEPRTEWLGMRLTHTVKEIYKRAPDNVKTAARRAFEAVLLSWFIGTSNIQGEDDKSTLIFNINMNIAEAKAEANPQINVNVDLKAIRDILQLLEFLYQEASKSMIGKTRQVIKQRVQRAEKTLRDLMINLN